MNARVSADPRSRACVRRMITVPMGCGGSRSAAIEPRYYESRDTESTWLNSTDTAAGNGTGDSDNTAAAAAGQTRSSLYNTERNSLKSNQMWHSIAMDVYNAVHMARFYGGC